jgi:hypothetical protein
MGDHRPSLGSHRLLGEGLGAALIRPDGEIDWWCPDRFEAEPLMWSLLDPNGGRSRWCGASIASWDGCPAGPTSHTTVRVDGQRVRLWDGLVTSGDHSVLIRLARSEEAPVPLRFELSLGGFDREPTWSPEGAERSPHGRLTMSGPSRPIVAEQHRWTGIAISPSGRSFTTDELIRMLERAERRDRQAMDRISLPRRHPSRATDALRVLRALTDPRSGAPVAAPTTSLPEAPGGQRQFDYRYSWLRDSALAVSTATLLGHLGAAGDYLDFVADLLDREGSHLTPLTRSSGGPVPTERDVDGIEGWASSRPVRIGNAATDQRQLDAVASVIDAVSIYAFGGGRFTRRRRAMVEHLAALLAETPPGPSSGIWELRKPAHLVSEELARWHGLDRALTLMSRRRPWRRHPDWQAARAAARTRVEAAWDDASGLLPQCFDATDVTPDAATLLAATGHFWERDDPRLRRHVRGLIAALEEGPFLRRYPPADDGFAGREHTFLPVAWWAVTALAMIGDVDAAQHRADALCAQLPSLQPEEWDVGAGMALGNFPLLWSHAEAARALYTLDREHLRARFASPVVDAMQVARSLRVRVLGSRR